MTWFRVDDLWHSHPKVASLSLAARGLWVTAGSWCGSHLTDGVVPRAMLRAWGAKPALAAELVACGLWEAIENGWVFHEWLIHNPARITVLSQRDAATERQRKWRESRRDKDVSHGGSNGHVTLPRPDPTRPDPDLRSEDRPLPPHPDVIHHLPDAATLIRLGYTQRYADRLGYTPTPKSLGTHVPPVAEWVRENAPLQGMTEAALVEALLDGLFARDDLEPKRWPLSFVGTDAVEFLGHGPARDRPTGRTAPTNILVYDDLPTPKAAQ